MLVIFASLLSLIFTGSLLFLAVLFGLCLHLLLVLLLKVNGKVLEEAADDTFLLLSVSSPIETHAQQNLHDTASLALDSRLDVVVESLLLLLLLESLLSLLNRKLVSDQLQHELFTHLLTRLITNKQLLLVRPGHFHLVDAVDVGWFGPLRRLNREADHLNETEEKNEAEQLLEHASN